MHRDDFKTPPSLTGQSYNPYQAPTTHTQNDEYDDAQLLDEPNRLPAGHGVSWIGQAWRIFLARPFLWLMLGVGYVVLMTILSFIPIVNFLVGLFHPCVVAGLAYVAYQIDVGDDVGLGDVFVGFRHQVVQQVLLVGLSMVVVFVALAVMAVLMGIFGSSLTNPSQITQNTTAILIMILVGLIFFIPLSMVMWLAPILVLFHEMSALSAMKLSFKACVRNILPFLVYTIVIGLIAIIAMIPFGLGYFVLLPMLFISMYVIYKDILIAHH